MVVGPRHIVVTLFIVASALLSGCVSGDADDPPDTPPAVVTDPTDYGYLDDATSTNQAHIHDYWGGATQKTLIDKTEYASGIWMLDRFEGFIEMRPDDGDVVPQGTGRVDVTVSWRDEAWAAYGDIELFVKTANMTRPDRSLGVLEQGKTITFEITNDDADLPHQVLSNWLYAFTFTHHAVSPMIAVDTDITLQMVAYRTLELPVFPAHPDHWGNETGLHLLSDRHDSGWAAYGYGSEYCLFTNETDGPSCFYTHVPAPGAVVPREADHVKVVIEQESDNGAYVTLAYHGADQRAFHEPEPESVEGGTWTYILKTGGSETDGPYSKQSLWEFELWTHAANGMTGNVGAFIGSYTITATVYRAAI